MTTHATSADPHALVREVLAFRPSPTDATALADALARDGTGRGPLWQLLVGANLLPFTGLLLEWHHVLGRLDASQAQCLRQAAEANALRQALLIRRATEATRVLAAHGVVVGWLKGAWISACVVERPGMRYMEDVDLLVPGPQFDLARDALLAKGFVADMPGEFLDERLPAISLRRPDELPGADGVLRIDLHHGVAASADRVWSTEAFWSSAMRRRVQGLEVTVPSHAAGLVIAALHAFKHGYDTRHHWTAVADASAILRAAGASLDLEWLEAHMREPRIATALYMLLSACSLPHSGTASGDTARHLQAAAATRVSALGVRDAADRVLHHGRRLRPITGADFSLMAVSEQPTVSAAARRFASAFTRRRRREAAGVARQPRRRAIRSLSAWSAVLRTNWRYAYTTFLVGRLVARLDVQARADDDPPA